jgi:hypothetical protein
MKKIVFLLISFSLIFGCASAANKRSLKGLPDYDFSVEIPQGWYKPKNETRYLITKEQKAVLLYVFIQQRSLDRSFNNTKKKLRKQMLPLESAGIIIDELASDRRIMNFNVLENSPAVIDGHAGFKILFTHKNKKGFKYQTLYYGFTSGNSFFNLRYSAGLQDYYNKGIADFKSILNSFKLVEK